MIACGFAGFWFFILGIIFTPIILFVIFIKILNHLFPKTTIKPGEKS